MKSTNIKLWVFLLTTTFVACSDDFVTVTSQVQHSENYFNSEQDYQDALVGAYDLLQATYLNVMLGEIASDNTLAGGESATDVLGIQQIDDMQHTPSNQQLRDIWGWMYAGINRANYILEFQNKIDFSTKQQILSEAKFLRAYYYFELIKWFGDVPLVVDKRILFGEETTLNRTPKKIVYQQIEADLLFAINHLPAISSAVGSVTKGATQAFLGKIYLYQNKFTAAATVLDAMIATGPYDLMTDYQTIFEKIGENNRESVFEIQYTELEGASFDCLQCSEGNVAVGFSGVRNYVGTLYTSGFSFNVPVKKAVDAFELGDQRKNTAILDIAQWARDTGATYEMGYEHTGYFNKKYLPRVRSANATADRNLTNPNNYRAIRFADVLLMAAEAYNRGNISDLVAQNYLNRVRRRAFGDVLHDITLTGIDLTNAIYKERRVELFGEGHRFFDLVRTGEAATQIDGFVTGKHEVFPIPLIEIQLAGNRWRQNPKY